MNHDSTNRTEADSGRKYWRSLDELADTPEFRLWAEREFPSGAAELSDPVTRRSFVKLMSASFLLAGVGLAGCRKPRENIYPFSKMPEGYVHGVAKYFATSMPTRGTAVPLLAKSNDGRPTKLEGNPGHPDSNGGTDRYTQASILNLYDPDRATRVAQNGNNASEAAAFDFLAQLGKEAAANQGAGLSFLAERSSSPTRARLQKLIAGKLPQSTWHEYESVDFDIHRQAATTAFGQPVAPDFKLDAASVIVSLDCDFLGSEENLHVHIRNFARGRKTRLATDPMNRLYAIEGLMTSTGANADHRLRIPTSQVPAAAAALAVAILGQSSVTSSISALAQSFKGKAEWIKACAADLAANKGRGLVMAGHRQPLTVHLLAHAINAALDNVGKTVMLQEAADPAAGTIAELAAAIAGNKVSTLVVLGGNPSYNAPADLNWAQTLAKAKDLNVVRLGYYEDESFPQKGWSLPLAHFLESWGDARTSDGTVVSVQPLIEPLFDGLTEVEILARIVGVEKPAPYELVRETFRLANFGGDEDWKKFLHDGYQKDSAAKQVSVSLSEAAVVSVISSEALAPAAPVGKDRLEVVFHRDYKVDDGRFNNNGWLQELPDPVTKLTWENVMLMSLKTAQELGVYVPNKENNRIKTPRVKLQLDGRTVEGPVWVQLGQADYTVGVALGYGRTAKGRIGRGSGFDAGAIRTTKHLHCATGATLTDTKQLASLSITQDHWKMEGRSIIREATLGEYREFKQAHPAGNFAKGFDAEKPPVFEPLYPNPFDEAKKTGHHQWGMSIDLSSCVGCSSCMVACQSENNIPIVGKFQVAANREMHWIRIDRYFTTTPGRSDNTMDEDDIQVINQPMLCQHCEAAPCENVCPVNATTHDQEGLNVMVYNRCVGTRYCSNNCPYKVRRFNYFDYNRRTIEQLTGPVYTTPLLPTKGQASVLDWWNDPDRGSKPSDEWELLKLVKNPDVTVRMRGVMEKCSYCLQRIEGAKIAQKVKARDSGDVLVPDGTFKTACQQACPAEAIVFGNIADPESKVSQQKALDRDYNVLDTLNTRPRTTYLARLRNPNPVMPDAYKTPDSTKEFRKANPDSDPFGGEGGEKTAGKGEG